MLGRFPAVPQLLDSSKADPYPIFDHVIEITQKGIYLAQLSYPNAIAIDSKTKEIYVLQDTPASIFVFSDIGKFIEVIRLKKISFPHGIAIHEDNIYLTGYLSHYIFHFKKNSTGIYLVAKNGGYGQSTGKFSHPKQLTISSYGEIFIADFSNNRIQILDSDLHYQQPISHHCMKLPEDVKLRDEEVYVLCKGTPFFFEPPFVHVFSRASEKIRSLAIPVHGPFFCLDTVGNIFITNLTKARINILTKNGKLLDTLIKPNYGVGFIQNAKGMASIDDFKLIVASSSTISLCMFSSF